MNSYVKRDFIKEAGRVFDQPWLDSFYKKLLYNFPVKSVRPLRVPTGSTSEGSSRLTVKSLLCQVKHQPLRGTN